VLRQEVAQNHAAEGDIPVHVPLLDLKIQYKAIKSEIQKSLEEVLESQEFIMGPHVDKLETAIADYSRARYAIGVSSGTDALLAALMSLDIRPGDEVITTPFTFFSTAGTIARLNARPVFVDIEPVTFNMVPSQIERVITRKTRAIIPIHLFGQCADMDPILEIARKRNLRVVEDAAQSIGAEYKGRRAGSMGDMGIFSFFPSKNLGGFGDGGMVVTNDEALFEKVKLLRAHGMHPKYYHKIVGGNFRLDALQAAVLSVKLKYLDGWSQGRRMNAAYYDRKFRVSGLIERGLIQIPEAVYKENGDRNYHIYNQYTLRVKDRDRLQAHLKQNLIGSEIYYPVALHLQECFQDLGYKAGAFPVSGEAAKSVLSIPIYPELTDAQKDYVVGMIEEFYA
jgi:dTDP-4-amino-4,6-dideoxygalactose transaminase